MEKPFQMYKNLFVEYIQSGCDVGNEMGREMYIEDKSLDIYFAIISNLKKLEEWEFSFFISLPPPPKELTLLVQLFLIHNAMT